MPTNNDDDFRGWFNFQPVRKRQGGWRPKAPLLTLLNGRLSLTPAAFKSAFPDFSLEPDDTWKESAGGKEIRIRIHLRFAYDAAQKAIRIELVDSSIDSPEVFTAAAYVNGFTTLAAPARLWDEMPAGFYKPLDEQPTIFVLSEEIEKVERK